TAVILSLVLSWLIFRQRPTDRMAIFLSFYLILFGVGFSGPVEAVGLYLVDFANTAYAVLSSMLFGPLSVILITTFPNGRFAHPWSRWIVLASLPVGVLGYTYDWFLNSPPFNFLMWLATFYSLAVITAAFYTQVYRFRSVSSHQERQQTKWVVYGLALWIISMLISTVPYLQVQNLPPGETMPWWVPAGSLLWAISLIFLPASLAISITRYRLYDIDIIINRTVVYTALTATVAVLYIFIVGGLGSVFQTSGNMLISLLGTGLVAVFFNPLRLRLQSAVNTMMFGDRDEPYEVLRRLGRLLESSAAPEAVLPSIVETIAKTLKIPHAEITIKRNGDFATAAVYGRPMGNLVEFPLSYQAEIIGQLLVSPRSGGVSFTEADHVLLRQIALQAGPAVQAIQLTKDLQASRVRLVTAREEERRRLRRDLHDGLGPVLASQGLKMAAASQLLRDDPEKARKLLEDLASQNESTVAEIRRLVYDLRPAALDDLGLVGALREYAGGVANLEVQVVQPEEKLPQMPAAIEVAAYRIAAEALTNVVRHARARRCTLELSVEEGPTAKFLRLQVSDDGQGLPEDRRAGVGLNSMRERAEEIGGEFQIESPSKNGTRIIARLPLKA
ncbi:MAG: sensor histidine kinase, partial [Anaerolineae bacterium]|nr:sensor histidine kinase [Anaerolineae bacterium]